MKGIKVAYSFCSIVERTPSRLRDILAKQDGLQVRCSVVDGLVV